MLSSLFKTKPLLETEASQWLYDAFAWALNNFDRELFYNETKLILPTNAFFPGRADSELAMATLMFDQVKGYAAVSHWPTRLADQRVCDIPEDLPQIEVKGALRGVDGIVDSNVSDDEKLLIRFNPDQINNPEGMIATFAHVISHHLGQMTEEYPPGGAEYWPHITEVLAIYLGFGVMFTNSAFTFRGGCGSCGNSNASRDASLSEQETIYTLAIFSVLKKIPNTDVTTHLKKHLRSAYKKAVKEVKQRIENEKLF